MHVPSSPASAGRKLGVIGVCGGKLGVIGVCGGVGSGVDNGVDGEKAVEVGVGDVASPTSDFWPGSVINCLLPLGLALDLETSAAGAGNAGPCAIALFVSGGDMPTELFELCQAMREVGRKLLSQHGCRHCYVLL